MNMKCEGEKCVVRKKKPEKCVYPHPTRMYLSEVGGKGLTREQIWQAYPKWKADRFNNEDSVLTRRRKMCAMAERRERAADLRESLVRWKAASSSPKTFDRKNVVGDGSCFYYAVLNFMARNPRFTPALYNLFDRLGYSLKNVRSVPDQMGTHHVISEGRKIETNLVKILRDRISDDVPKSKGPFVSAFVTLWNEASDHSKTKRERAFFVREFMRVTNVETREVLQKPLFDLINGFKVSKVETVREYLRKMEISVRNPRVYADEAHVFALAELLKPVGIKLIVLTGKNVPKPFRRNTVYLHLDADGQHYNFFTF
jgi:hypothetical protein